MNKQFVAGIKHLSSIDTNYKYHVWVERFGYVQIMYFTNDLVNAAQYIKNLRVNDTQSRMGIYMY